jgi:hypothetical protein
MLHVLDGSWKPNDEDKKNKLVPGKILGSFPFQTNRGN